MPFAVLFAQILVSDDGSNHFAHSKEQQIKSI